MVCVWGGFQITRTAVTQLQICYIGQRVRPPNTEGPILTLGSRRCSVGRSSRSFSNTFEHWCDAWQFDSSRIRHLDAGVQAAGRSCRRVLRRRAGSLSAFSSRGHDDCGCWHAVLEQKNLEEYTDTCFGVEVCGGTLSERISVLESEILVAILRVHNIGR